MNYDEITQHDLHPAWWLLVVVAPLVATGVMHWWAYK
jgi:hypothetical protein